MSALPVEKVLPDVLDALQKHSAVVLQAEPGAGKTTKVPLALLKAPFLGDAGIIMLEPRRLAATNAARWMSACLGESVGATVGFAIRFERKISRSTRIEVVTEGILTRRLQQDPLLSGVGVVIFDEFHERSIHTDLALALCRDIQLALRPDLKIVVMSATLESGEVAKVLGDVPIVASEGSLFPVEIRYASADFQGDPARVVEQAVIKACRETTDGDILAFLPGAGEIRRCQSLLKGRNELAGVDVYPLYGDLPFADQERAILPSRKMKVVLATNVAETSLTIEGLRVVVDSGLCRRLRFDPATGLERLVTERISRASASQRSGRAGRLGPGVCYRLWTEHVQNSLLPYHPPEIRTADLTSLALELALWGVKDPASLSWVDPPASAAFAEAHRLLERLGAVRNGVITPAGKEMALLPVHPRLAHMLLAAKARGAGALGCDLAAILSERDIFRSNTFGSPALSESDLVDRLETLREWRREGRTALADPVSCRMLNRTAEQIRRLIGAETGSDSISVELVGILLAAAYPDRIARLREPGSAKYLMANGRGAVLSERSAVRNQQFIVAVDVDNCGAEGIIRLASALTLADIQRELRHAISRQRKVVWDEKEERVQAVDEECLDSLVLTSRQVTPTKDEVREVILSAIRGKGVGILNWTNHAQQYLSRVRLLARLFPEEWPDFSDRHLEAELPEWFGPALGECRSLSDLQKIDLVPLLRARLPWDLQRKLDQGAPSQVAVPSGSLVRIDYCREEGPVLAVKLQELFGLAETPAVGFGKVPLLLHLLSPAGRPMQVTRDLRNFWNTGYPEVKKQLKGRYPRHPWPDDPWNAIPTRGTKKKAEPRQV